MCPILISFVEGLQAGHKALAREWLHTQEGEQLHNMLSEAHRSVPTNELVVLRAFYAVELLACVLGHAQTRLGCFGRPLIDHIIDFDRCSAGLTAFLRRLKVMNQELSADIMEYRLTKEERREDGRIKRKHHDTVKLLKAINVAVPAVAALRRYLYSGGNDFALRRVGTSLSGVLNMYCTDFSVAGRHFDQLKRLSVYNAPRGWEGGTLY